VKLLLDTHLLLWASLDPDKLSDGAVALLEADDSELFFSASAQPACGKFPLRAAILTQYPGPIRTA